MRDETSLRRWWLGALLAVCLAWAAPVQARPFVYVTNHASGSVSQYDASGGSLTPLNPPAVATGSFPFGVAVSPDGKGVYVANQSGSVSQFDVGSAGALTPKSPPTVAASFAVMLAVSPDGKSVYVTHLAERSVFQFDVGANGTLTPKNPPTVPAGFFTGGVAVAPDGRNVYVADVLDDTVSQYDVGTGGVLSPKTPATVPTGDRPFGVAVSPDGKSVYVTNYFSGGSNTVSQYDVGPGGALTPKAPATVGTGVAPFGGAFSPDGDSFYLTNLEISNQVGSWRVAQFNVGPGGVLRPKTPPSVGLPASVGSDQSPVAVSPDGKSVYVADGGFGDAVAQFSVGSGGTLTPKTPATVPSGGQSHAIAIAPPHAPSTQDQCKNGGWRNFPQFRNQGQCVSFVQTGK